LKDYTIKQLIRMEKSIVEYNQKEIDLWTLTQKLWELYEAIEDEEKSLEFKELFHKSFDALEEIVAVDNEAEYENDIKSIYLPNLSTNLNKMIKGYPNQISQ